MRYFTPEEIRANKDLIKEKFELRPGKRVLVLKGKNVGIFQEFVPDFQAKILDAGIGSGAFVQAISDKGYANIFACDIDEYMAAGAKPLLKEFRTLDISFDPLPWPDNFFDALTAWDVLEHVENPHEFLKNIRALLKEGTVTHSRDLGVSAFMNCNRKHFLLSKSLISFWYFWPRLKVKFSIFEYTRPWYIWADCSRGLWR